MSQLGYTAVLMGHRESGFAALRADMSANGVMKGLAVLVSDPKAEQARLLDVGAALQWAESQCKPPFRVLLGHSMGAETVMLEAGAKDKIGVDPEIAGRDRFAAYVAMSPEGPGLIFPEHAWKGIRKPMLVLTGTRDREIQGGPPARQIPWSELPGSASKCQWLGVLDGATHMNFAGVGLGAARAKPLITETISSFLTGVQNAACTLPASQPGMTLRAK
jgi:dienelactone hydrolase